MRRYWLFLQSLVLAVLVTWPISQDLGYAAVGSKDGDVYKHLWTLWWMRREIASGEPGIVTTLVNPPTGMPLWPIEPLNGILSLGLPMQPVMLSNVLALVHVFLLGVCAGWLGLVVSGRPTGAWIAGALAQCSAFTAFTLEAGIGELRQFWWVPLGLGCVVRARDTGRWAWFGAVGACLVGATLSCFYHGFFLALGTLVYALVTLRPWAFVRFGVVAVAASLAVAVPVRTFAESFNPETAIEKVGFERWMSDASKSELDTFAEASVDPIQLVKPRSADRVDATRAQLTYQGGRYLGVVALVLAGMGMYAEPRRGWVWLPVGAAGLVLSLGTVLWWDGEVASPGGTRIVLPLAWINRVMGYWIDPVNFPSRFIAVTTIAVSALASLASKWRWTLPIAAFACLDLIAGDLVPWPRERARLPDVTGLDLSAGVGAVANITEFADAAPQVRRGSIVFPLDLRGPSARARLISAQIVLDRPFDCIPIERMDRWGPQAFLWLWSLPLARALMNQDGDAAKAEPDTYRPDFWLLRDAGYDSLIVTHAAAGMAPWTETFLQQVAGLPIRTYSATIWEVPEVTATEAETAEWLVLQEARARASKMPKMGPQIPRPRQ